MSKFIRYSSEFVQSFRPGVDEVISEKLSKHFDMINELFLESTQYQDNRKKINYNQINSQKWRSINNNIVNSILLLLNGIDISLYNEIESKIVCIDIKDLNNMRKIIEILHEKSCESYNSHSVLNLYIKLLTKLINEGKWYYKIGDKITDYICPRIVAVSIAQKNYLEMLDTFLAIIDNYNKTQDEISYFKVKNQKFIGNMLYIGKLYNNNIISTELINIICNDIITKVKKDIKNADLLEFLIELLKIIEEYPNLNTVKQELDGLKDTVPTRIKFLIINYIESNTVKNVVQQKIVVEVKKTNDTYTNLIVEYLINNSYEDYFNALKEKVDGEFVIGLLRKYNPKCEDKLLLLVIEMMSRKKITQQYIIDKLNEYEKKGDLEDIIEECPIITKFIKKLKG
jgi:hypothetical protein